MTATTRAQVSPTRRAHTQAAISVAAIGSALLLSMVVATALGPADLSPGDVTRSIAAHLGIGTSPLSPTEDAIVWLLRLPRILTAALVGASLAVCGVVIQGSLRNSLADPYLLGLSAGASFGAVGVIVVGIAVALPVAAFAGALVALGSAATLARLSSGPASSAVLLAGIATSALFAALTSLVIFWSATGDTYREILSWLLGSLAGATWTSVATTCVAFLVIGVPLMMTGTTLDAFSFGDRSAGALGIDSHRSRWTLLVASALLTGAAVSVSGAIGFVGLVAPHVARLMWGPGHRALLPMSALCGALLLVWSDAIARVAFSPRELPVGIVTSLLGAPILAVLLIRSRRP